MKVLKSSLVMLALALVWGWQSTPARAQEKATQDSQHVVSMDELNQDAAKPAETRQSNEAAVRQLFSSDTAQKALKDANVDYKKVDKAIGQLSDEDLAKVAQRSRDAQKEFAAGGMGGTLIIVIVLIAVLIIVLAIVF